MYSRLVIEGNAVYEIDEECAKEKQSSGFGRRRRELGQAGMSGPQKREQGRYFVIRQAAELVSAAPCRMLVCQGPV